MMHHRAGTPSFEVVMKIVFVRRHWLPDIAVDSCSNREFVGNAMVSTDYVSELRLRERDSAFATEIYLSLKTCHLARPLLDILVCS